MSGENQAVIEVASAGTPRVRRRATVEIGPTRPPAAQRPSPVQWNSVVGSVVAIGADGVPLVEFRGNPTGRAVPARTTVFLSRADEGTGAVLLFEQGDPSRPIIVGKLLAPASPLAGA